MLGKSLAKGIDFATVGDYSSVRACLRAFPDDKNTVEYVIATLKGPPKPFLLQPNHPHYKIAVFRQFPVGGAEVVHYHRRHFGQEGLSQAQPPPVADSPADDPPQHIAPPFVARHDTVPNQERRRPGVFSHYPQGVVRIPVNPVSLAAEPHRLVDDGAEQVRFIDIGLIL